ncbi:hypothetical protein QZH41_002365 [Actinostola sp. cb2023]|nr:hypothetical protein QZH41_002365 [Actinostola sp. cb2023]
MGEGFLEEKMDDPRSTVTTKLNGVAVAVTETPLAITEGEVDSLGAIASESGGKVTKRFITDERPLKVPNDQSYLSKSSRMLLKSFIRRAKDFKPDSLFLDALRSSMDCSDNDGEALFAMCLIYAAIKNQGSRVRTVTLEMAIVLLKELVLFRKDGTTLPYLQDRHLALVEDVETAPDKEDSRSLFITIHQPFTARSLTKVRTRPILSSKFVFDDYIRCMSARQRLQRRRTMLKQNKLHSIAQLLELPAMATPPAHYYTITPPDYINLGSGNPYPSHDTRSSQYVGGRERADAFSTISDPGECLSPYSKFRTTSQAQALALVLEQSPPQGDGSITETRVTENAVSRVRTISVEEAEEALDMEHRNGHNPSPREDYYSVSICIKQHQTRVGMIMNRDMEWNNVTGMGMRINGDVGWEQWDKALVASIAMSFYTFLCPVSAKLCNRFGCRVVMFHSRYASLDIPYRTFICTAVSQTQRIMNDNDIVYLVP